MLQEKKNQTQQASLHRQITRNLASMGPAEKQLTQTAGVFSGGNSTTETEVQSRFKGSRKAKNIFQEHMMKIEKRDREIDKCSKKNKQSQNQPDDSNSQKFDPEHPNLPLSPLSQQEFFDG